MSNVTPIRRLCEYAVAKLATSGLSPAHGDALGLYSVADATTLHKHFAPVRALVIPYDDHFYRIRYLEDFPKSFKQKDRGKYDQIPGSGVRAYFPKSVDWDTVRDDVRETLIITEGEFKAAAACAREFYTIGLGGVNNFKTKDTEFLPELEEFTWQDRDVFIAYDSDAATKPLVAMATTRLVEQLRARGARVRVMRLPSRTGAKVGLDDYLLTHTDEELAALAEEADEGYPPEFIRLNEEVVYVGYMDRVIAIADPAAPPMTPQAFMHTSAWASRTYKVPAVTGRGQPVFKEAFAAPAWMKWPNRRNVDKIVYEPGQPPITDKSVNAWSGWGVESTKGDVQPWLDLTRFVFEGAEPGHLGWFYDWCAYPIQHPGAKLAQAVLVHGVATGTGKTLIGVILGDIYGENYSAITAAELKSAFNGWARHKQFIMGDEISSGDKRSENDRMKSMITQESMIVNVKNQPTYSIRDCINYYFTSNHPDALFLESFDRRIFVHGVIHDLPQESEFYQRVIQWRNAEGPSALRHWLENREIDSSFNPGGHAPRTAAREAMTLDSASDLGLWCLNLKAMPDEMLVFGILKHQRDMFSAQELLDIYWRTNDTTRRVTANGMTRALKSAGFRQVYGGKPVRANDKRDRYFAVRNTDKWLNPSSKFKQEVWLRTNIELKPK